jgi:LuxR family maltose regulon positive regulatory protein
MIDDVERLLEPIGAPSTPVVVVDEDEFASLPARTAMYRAGLALLAGDTAATAAHASRALDRTAEHDHLGRGAAAALLGLAHWSDGDLVAATGRYAESIVCFQRAEHHADVLGCSRVLADIQVALGRPGAAMRTLEAGLELARTHGPLRGTADMHAVLAELFLERNDLPAARTHVQASADLDDRLALPQNAHRWRVALARLLQIDGDVAGALDLLHEAEELYDTDFSPSIRPVPAVAARVMLAAGDVDSAQRWASVRGLAATDELSYVTEYEHLTLARLLLKQDDATGRARHVAIGLLDRLRADAEAGQRAGSVIDVLALHALAHQAAGDVATALAALEEALTRAVPEGYVRLFLDHGAPMIGLLRTAAQRGVAVEPSRRLLAEAQPTPGSTTHARAKGHRLVDDLSRRELEVLRLLRSDLSGPDIARELTVSLNTVRTHTKSIYMKLGVNSRRSAVRRAAELGL